MGITSELRAFVDAMDRTRPYEAERLCKVADRIDAEHDEMRDFCERLERAATDREDVTLWGVDYTALPLDANGETIRLGDDMETLLVGHEGEHSRVEWISLTADGWEVDGEPPTSMLHHHAPTVEDVLREFARDFDRWRDYDGPINKAPSNPVAKYAKRLTLADGEGE